MNELVAFLKEWKELVGAVIGGLFSLLVALLVAHQARRAEERTSAMILIGELSRVTAMIEQARRSTEKHEVPTHAVATYMAEQFCHYRVRLSPLFEASMSRVMNCDTYLAANLTLAFAFLRDTEPVLERLEEDIALIRRGEELKRQRKSVDADIKTVESTYRRVGDHAKFAVQQLEQQVLGPFPTWHKLRRRVVRNEWERAYFALLDRERA